MRPVVAQVFVAWESVSPSRTRLLDWRRPTLHAWDSQPQSHSDETASVGEEWTGERHSDDGHARDECTREESGDDDDETKLCRGFRLSPRYGDDDDARDGLGN